MKWFFLLCLVLVVAGCERKPLREEVNEQISERTVTTNDPTRGLEPTARKDAQGEEGIGTNVDQKAEPAAAPK